MLEQIPSDPVYAELLAANELPKPRGIDAYLDALRDSEGEEFYLTHVSVASLQEASRGSEAN